MRMFQKNFFLVSFVLFSITAMATSAFAVWEENYTAGHRYYTTMSLVESLDGDVSSITPVIDDNKIPYGDADDYLDSSSCLGIYGPLGAYGPLGTLGPIGDNTWNLSYWISGYGSWSDWEDDIDGPLGPNGPLGYAGPVATVQYYGTANPGLTLFATNDFARHTRALGVWTPLGPIGPLGALGALGPLGPIGAHGYAVNANGEYVQSGVVKRSVTIWYNAAQTQQRTYDLYEKYSESFAKAKTDNDTSFMVTGRSSSYTDVDVYKLKSKVNQLVTIVLVPEKQLDIFSLTIVDSSNNVVAVSNSDDFINWVQLKVPANRVLKAKVQCMDSGHILSSTYRLYVTGSTGYLRKTEIQGSHISDW